MNCLGLWLLFFLLLGHQIHGVNRELPNSEFFRDSVLEALNHYQEDVNKMDGKKSIAKSDVKRSSLSHYPSVQGNFTTLCNHLDSCASRCGLKPKNSNFTCNCDSLCHQFSDCCFDYEEHCASSKGDGQVQTTNVSRFSCAILFMKYNVFAVTSCSSSSQNDVDKLLCSIKMPKECVFLGATNQSGAGSVVGHCKELVYRTCMSKLRFKCNEDVEPQCKNILNSHCSKHALSFCRRCNTNFWPVFDPYGIIYRNSHCAACNSKKDYTLLTPRILKNAFKELESPFPDSTKFPLLIRRCAVNAVDSCPENSDGENFASLCSNHSGAVMTKGRKPRVYKNLFCALCNGEGMNDLTCAPKAHMMQGLIKTVPETFITGDGNGMRLDDIPAAFSILLNFGLGGRQRMYFSSDSEDDLKQHQKDCPPGKIWDPFSQMCRKLYCSTEFVLVDYRCVRKENELIDANPENKTSVIPDARADYVHLSLNAEMEILDFLQFNGQDIDTINETLRRSLAKSFNINIDRIRDVTFNISLGNGDMNKTLADYVEAMDDTEPIFFKIDFDLFDANVTDLMTREPSVDNIVSMLASALSMNGFEFSINNVTSRIIEIHQSVTPLTGWCAAENQEKIVYWNSEFNLIMDGEYSSINTSAIKGIYVNKTRKFYPIEEFVADILFQGYQFSGNLINVSGMAIVCDTKAKLNESCIRILIEQHEYALEKNSLFVHNESLKNAVDDSFYEEADNGSIWVCLKSLQTSSFRKKSPLEMYIAQAIVSYILLLISVTALAIVLLTYIFFSSLRNLPGCNTMNLTFSLLATHLTFIFGLRSNVTGNACIAIGHLLHYEFLCCFTWMNVMAFDLFQTFGNRKVLSNIRCKRQYLPKYMAYSYLSPLVVITASSLLDIYLYDSPFAPHYGFKNTCWIANKYSALVFFALPLAIVMCINLAFFILTILAIRSVKTVFELSDQKTQHRVKNDVLIYSKMALVVGLTWALSFAAAYVKDHVLIGQILTYLFIVFNTLQGVFIFWAFICNQKVYLLYKDAFNSIVHKVSNRKRFEGSSQTIRRLANVMKRTISSDTVVSTISGGSNASDDSQLPAIAEKGMRK